MGIKIGCAGWALAKAYQDPFPSEGTHLVRYSQVLPVVEINSCFYRYHKPETYARWAEETPDTFRFALKFPQLISHEQRLLNSEEAWTNFQAGFERLGSKLGPLLLQLPPSLSFHQQDVEAFFDFVRSRFEGTIVCEPRHKTWFNEAAEECLDRFHIARAAADPALLSDAAQPLDAHTLAYYRLHGSPVMYESNYENEWLDQLCETLLAAAARTDDVWCIFDNTTYGFATANALYVLDRLSKTPMDAAQLSSRDIYIPARPKNKSSPGERASARQVHAHQQGLS